MTAVIYARYSSDNQKEKRTLMYIYYLIDKNAMLQMEENWLLN